MEDVMASTEAEVRALIDRRSEAMRSKDLERLMPVYAPEIVYFDLVPGLRYTGQDELGGRFAHWFEGFSSSIRQDVSELHIDASGDLAVAHMLIRAGGTLVSGTEVGFWVRATSSCRRSVGEWQITHEHISVPVDLGSGKAATDLVP
jgi:ketosteroid isomerase-like protein